MMIWYTYDLCNITTIRLINISFSSYDYLCCDYGENIKALLSKLIFFMYKIRFIKGKLTSKEAIKCIVPELSLSQTGGYRWTHCQKCSRRNTCPCAAAIYRKMGMVIIKGFRLRDAILGKGSSRSQQGECTYNTWDLAIGTIWPSPPEPALPCFQRGKRKNYRPRHKRFARPQAVSTKNKNMKKCLWYAVKLKNKIKWYTLHKLNYIFF